jgi:hypothetical protein
MWSGLAPELMLGILLDPFTLLFRLSLSPLCGPSGRDAGLASVPGGRVLLECHLVSFLFYLLYSKYQFAVNLP